MSNNCPTTPYKRKASPYSEKASPFAAKAGLISPATFCPVLLQETGFALLQEDGGKIEL
jgi:hypothetical protein